MRIPKTNTTISSRDSRGASLVEYGVVLGLVGLVSVSVVRGYGLEIAETFNGAERSLAQVTYDPDAFIFEVSTATGAIFPYSGGTIEIDWGDPTANATCTTTYVVDSSGPLTCDYPKAGTYRISITGDITRYGQLYSAAYKSDITRVIQWGNTGLTDLINAFYGASNLTDIPPDLPPEVTRLTGAFKFATNLNDPDFSLWDTSNVRYFSMAFSDATRFNADISGWDTSSAISTYGMFHNARAFNRDLSSWDVSSVDSFWKMFEGASSFSQDLSSWDTSSVETITLMFSGSAFNGDISTWDTSKVEYMTEVFSDNTDFDQDISGWDVSQVQSFSGMFRGASAFSADLASWDVSSATEMDGMFDGASNATSDLSGWCVPLVGSPPTAFSDGSGIVADPVWGNCP